MSCGSFVAGIVQGILTSAKFVSNHIYLNYLYSYLLEGGLNTSSRVKQHPLP
ncbi:uncharacterized protein TA14160 [Theileria annulata]|uniref:Uncharacterized protein n=1 Tax=Theileria annulata TaxID=5874 RepID=Q4UEX1_THEAN|nr:uncharacterized protein TA14160 [Theileria annulata]CAI74368.1 hypothetical protein TA14160 [Theileria annulata]|eukprot:XP_952100.1 hypothetical protein TA14160 [Theileria annulata]